MDFNNFKPSSLSERSTGVTKTVPPPSLGNYHPPMATSSAALLEGLNPPQREAVENVTGPLLILAGAGSGKTRVITHRIAKIIQDRLASPEQILAVTFTNKAAREMESRVFDLLTDVRPNFHNPMWITTFHAACVRILRQTIHLLDYNRTFTIYDDADQLSQIKKVMTALNVSDKVKPAKAFRSNINHAKMLGLTPEDVEKSSKLYFDKVTLDVFRTYESEMKKANALDFGDLLIKVLEIFKMYPDVLAQYQQHFKFVLVDEYQDTNHIQYMITKMIAEKHRNLCVVGDEDQSIYSWRGADISNIMNFEQDFPETKVVKLEENYRSTQTIVKAASQVIANNTVRKDKTLFTNNEAGEKIILREERSEYDEARWVIRQIQSTLNTGEFSPTDVAVFYRTNAQSRVLEEQLRMSGIPYRILGGVRFYERLEIKDVIGYLRLILNPADDVSFKRVVNTPTRGIGKTTIEKLEEIAFSDQLSMTDAAQKAIDSRVFPAGTTSKLRQFLNLMDELRLLAQTATPLDLYTMVIDKTEYYQRLKTEDSPESQARIENLEELSNAIGYFQRERSDASLQTFLEEMALVSDVDSMNANEQSVTLMTLHLSKGLEFPQVFIVGLEENLFPSAMSMEDEGDGRSVEEERRLAYVGMTRARQRLHLTYARTRKVWGQDQSNPPSRFLKEIPNELVEFTTALEMPKFMSRNLSEADYSSSTKDYSRPGRGRSPRVADFDLQSFPEDDFSANDGTGFSKGQKVRHPTFGVGTVYQTEGAGDQLKVSVLFADQTIKKFVAKFARLEKI